MGQRWLEHDQLVPAGRAVNEFAAEKVRRRDKHQPRTADAQRSFGGLIQLDQVMVSNWKGTRLSYRRLLAHQAARLLSPSTPPIA